MEVRSFTTKTGKDGHDLNDVAREIVRGLMKNRSCSENVMAKELGVSQRSLNRFLKNEEGWSLARFSRICAELEMNPVDFFRSHELYDRETRVKMRFAKDALYDRFRTLLTQPEATLVLRSVQVQKKLGIFEVCSETIQGMIRVAKKAREQAFRESRSRGRAAPMRR